MVAMAGVGLGGGLTVNGSMLDTMLPFATVTCAVPGKAIAVESIAAVSWVLLAKVVVCATPFQ